MIDMQALEAEYNDLQMHFEYVNRPLDQTLQQARFMPEAELGSDGVYRGCCAGWSREMQIRAKRITPDATILLVATEVCPHGQEYDHAVLAVWEDQNTIAAIYDLRMTTPVSPADLVKRGYGNSAWIENSGVGDSWGYGQFTA